MQSQALKSWGSSKIVDILACTTCGYGVRPIQRQFALSSSFWDAQLCFGSEMGCGIRQTRRREHPYMMLSITAWPSSLPFLFPILSLQGDIDTCPSF
jgi:hypothetical protein